MTKLYTALLVGLVLILGFLFAFQYSVNAKTVDFFQTNTKYNMVHPTQNKDSIVLRKDNTAVAVSIKKRKNYYSYVVILQGKHERVYHIPSGKKVIIPFDHGSGKKYHIMLLYSKDTSYELEGYVAKERKITPKFSSSKQYLSNNFVIQGTDNYQIRKVLGIKRFKNWETWTDTKKVEQVTDYIAKNFEYSDKLAKWQDTHWYTPYYYARFKAKDMVCYDAASITASLLREMGVKTKFVGGYWKGDKSTYHAWNEVYINGKWKTVDNTFNLRIPFKGGFMYPDEPVYEKSSDYIKKEFF